MSWMLTLAQTTMEAATQPATQPAAGTAAGEGPAWWNAGLIKFYLDGGRFMVPLFICQVIALGVIIERWMALKSIRINTTAFRKKIKSLVNRNQVDDAIAVCDKTPGPVAATVAVGLRRFKLLQAIGRPAEQIEADVTKSIDDYGVHMLAILEKHLPLLATVTALGPLFGFLGTVDGMVVSFADIEAAAGTGNIVKVAAAGIKVALYTTILGLVIGIFSQWFYNQFTSKINAIVLEVEETASELVKDLSLMAALGVQSLEDAEPAPAAPAAAPATTAAAPAPRRVAPASPVDAAAAAPKKVAAPRPPAG